MSDLKVLISKVANGQALSRTEAREAFNILMSGEATPSQIGGLLMGLRLRGETIDEITGAVEVMREKMVRVAAPPDAIDIVGTGGDASGSYNISTCAAFVAVGAGLSVAKHGNRALSSRSGAADVLTALGVRIDLPPEKITECIEVAGIGFMFAPAHHASMKHVGPTRVELGTRTIFNLLGPLSNPAGVRRQVTGVFARNWIEPLAQVLGMLGSERAWVCHGEGGFDEIVSTGVTWVAQLNEGKVSKFELSPEQVNLRRASADELKGADASHNADALRGVLADQGGAFRDSAVMTAGAAIFVAGKAGSFEEGVRKAEEAISSGRAHTVLERLVKVSNSS